MFIKNSIYSYNAEELLLATSKLTFALNACVTSILVMELIVVLLLGLKKHENRYFNPLFWVCMITFPFAQPTIMI
jgi:uncharacterized membrane-anchored protein